MKTNKRVVNAFEHPLMLLVDVYKKDELLKALMAARKLAQDDLNSKLLGKIDLCCWKRISELQRGF